MVRVEGGATLHTAGNGSHRHQKLGCEQATMHRLASAGFVVALHMAAFVFILQGLAVNVRSHDVTPLVVRFATSAAAPEAVPPVERPRGHPAVARTPRFRMRENPAATVSQTAPLPPAATPVVAPAAGEPSPAAEDDPPIAAAVARTIPVTAPSFDAAYLQNPTPRYPAVARRMGNEGRVVLRVHVAADGSPDEVQIRSSSGHGALDAAALEAVKGWRFVPARQGEQAVSAWVLVPITFTLQG